MASRKPPSRMDKRREAEAVEAIEKSTGTKKTATKAKAKTTRRKVKQAERKRLVWGVFSGTLREEARFPYNERAQAEEKLEQLRAKSKKLYFIQPIKELITDGSAQPRPFLDDDDDLPPAKLRRRQSAKEDREETPAEEYSDDVDDRDFDLSDMGMGDGDDD
ncbi:MAG: hypothetical protein DWH91_19880 [Planctomycetota bacterium]|nr:MAG: hypothetical protein DWH91_19880 [Planctomycetota bacterium]